jgi:hypothetical protein
MHTFMSLIFLYVAVLRLTATENASERWIANKRFVAEATIVSFKTFFS